MKRLKNITGMFFHSLNHIATCVTLHFWNKMAFYLMSFRKALSLEPDKNKQCNLAICLMHMNRIAEAKSLLHAVRYSSGNRPMNESYAKSFERALQMLTDLESHLVPNPIVDQNEIQTSFASLVNRNSKEVSSFIRGGLHYGSSQSPEAGLMVMMTKPCNRMNTVEFLIIKTTFGVETGLQDPYHLDQEAVYSPLLKQRLLKHGRKALTTKTQVKGCPVLLPNRREIGLVQLEQKQILLGKIHILPLLLLEGIWMFYLHNREDLHGVLTVNIREGNCWEMMQFAVQVANFLLSHP